MATNTTVKSHVVQMDVKAVVSFEITSESKTQASLEAQAALDELLTYLAAHQEITLSNGKTVKLNVQHSEIEPFTKVREADNQK
ncbi:hypothetical protein GCM10011391_15580 [Pullulanibacillus camelliae]|uniref:Uncharacterized protein n=1 Tax=Pullulanibacillus camelliae TaxID=1707096 RepID=A0A8J2YGR6_9BACL|nr:hypothetical protein [Pullulanibacillus camelliae]GGE37643.1 hypothetical protein GCM10011391_15580 [Pullulanibacillus camelliae]